MRIIRHVARTAGLTTLGLTLATWALALTPAAAVAQGPTPAAPASIKIGYIRGQDILAQTPGRADLEAQFNKEVDSARAVEKVWGDSINTMVSDYAKSEATLSADAKTTRQAAIREKQASFQQRSQQLEQQVQADNQRMVGPVLQRIAGIIDEVRQDGGYALIFDVQSQGGGLVSADKNLDLTDLVIARVKAAGPVTPLPAKPAPARPTAGPTSTPSGLSRPKNPQ